jgi:hypothetical protein
MFVVRSTSSNGFLIFRRADVLKWRTTWSLYLQKYYGELSKAGLGSGLQVRGIDGEMGKGVNIVCFISKLKARCPLHSHEFTESFSCLVN